MDPYNVTHWPLTKTTNQYDSFDSNYTSMGLILSTEVWVQALGQGTAIVDIAGTPTPFHCLLLKCRQRDVWADYSITISDAVTYRWIADDGTEIAAATAINAYMNPDNWNSLSGLITGTGCIRWLDHYEF